MAKKSRLSLFLFCLLVPTVMHAQEAKLKIKAALVDKDLNVKPIPKLMLSVQTDGGGAPVQISTGFDGQGSVQLAAGKYHLSSLKPVQFAGKEYSWKVDVEVKAGDNEIELSSDNATITEQRAGRLTDELTEQFKAHQNAVVTVWSEIGHGTGFLIEPKGLVVTNQHVVGRSEYLEIQFDRERKVRAVLLEADPKQDVAVLWADLSKISEAITATIAKGDGGEAPVIEGEKVFTIGSPLSQRKMMTTGIASKVEPHAIISDIHIDHGSSGGPLFNSRGEVVGITTFGESASVAGIVRIEEAQPLIKSATAKMAAGKTPSPEFLPVEPTTPYPIDAIKSVLQEKKFDTRPYAFNVGDYQVAFLTPPLLYYFEEGSRMKAAQEKEKRNKKHTEAVQGTFQPLDDLKNWGQYTGEYQPVILLMAMPKLKETTGSMWRRSLVGGLSGTGYGGAATVRFKTDFYKMKLKCGEKEIEPIHRGKAASMVDVHNGYVNATDVSYQGVYSYPSDAISPNCGTVVLEIYSEKDPNGATTKTLDEKTVSKVWADFEPYRQVLVSPATQH